MVGFLWQGGQSIEHRVPHVVCLVKEIYDVEVVNSYVGVCGWFLWQGGQLIERRVPHVVCLAIQV